MLGFRFFHRMEYGGKNIRQPKNTDLKGLIHFVRAAVQDELSGLQDEKTRQKIENNPAIKPVWEQRVGAIESLLTDLKDAESSTFRDAWASW